jgi:integrase
VTNKLKGRDVKLEPELANLLGTPGEDDDLVVSLGAPDWFRAARRLIVAAGLKPWRKPFHTLRKNRATWWRDEYPEHVVDAWMGHSLEVARRHYAAVPESAYQ